jgi:hypothetical protein
MYVGVYLIIIIIIIDIIILFAIMIHHHHHQSSRSSQQSSTSVLDWCTLADWHRHCCLSQHDFALTLRQSGIPAMEFLPECVWRCIECHLDQVFCHLRSSICETLFSYHLLYVSYLPLFPAIGLRLSVDRHLDDSWILHKSNSLKIHEPCLKIHLTF